ncbi:CaiB/BaiF CoA transferase family protein [Bosea psychrotolerans]|uniref:Crotonobetainyl-CoA:carnitine CoA-transferase CaiB-like acyl-CoA transferase n=1 Tax=Bosea psychrotolerans TaxID=1871628 RepID=A0A2S4MCH3_9HYPH|nr:CaiB/BaiF CoA-transferase family protein [Bosea psychrotolerans]POR52436.1 crotonobetainyl-CoA:carnitine CoA-transferase CaiB-like acyl-CoA transferase [Bosea psychrotolerans]
MNALPLEGVRVIEFSQMVMGPSCGMILADLGADVVKVEPPKGDRTRYFKSVASGFFNTYSRNKRSVVIDTTTEEGQATARKLIIDADVLIENFRPGLLGRYGLDYASLASEAPGLIYCSLKGYLPGPYENRLALDEVVQMMGGLAFMTGLPGKPMRAGASVNDIMGGMFGVIAIQAALARRARTGKGAYIQSALFENNVFLMAQAMMFESVTGERSIPWSVKESPWPVYDLFDTSGGEKIFVSIVGEEHWDGFCRAFGCEAWLEDPRLATSQGRVDNRSWIIPEIAAIIAGYDIAQLCPILERLGLPFAPVNRPGDLFDDPHLNASEGLLELTLNDGRKVKTPALPFTFDGQRLKKRRDPPAVGQHTQEVLAELQDRKTGTSR